MADADVQGMLVRIEATTAGLRRELDLGDSRVKKFADNSNRAGSKVDGAFGGMAASAARLLAPLASAVSAFEALSKAVEVQRQFDVLNAGLITATGSSAKAAVAFDALQRFAAKTPYSLDQAVEGFTKLVNLGLTPSEAALNSYGNTAAAMGKDLNQMIEAVADAATGEFERLKEFGITSSQQGDKVSLTFRGVTKTIGKNAKEIEGFLLNLGNTDFAGAMDQRAKTLDGAISNLGDTWDATFRLINERGLGDLMKESVGIAADALQELNDSIDSGQFEAYLDAIGGKFDGMVGDVAELLSILNDLFGEFFDGLGSDMGVATAAMVEAFKDFPENVRAFIQLMTVEVLAGFDKAQAYAVAFKDSVKAIFTDDTIDGVGQRLEQSLSGINMARTGSIEQILTERDTAVDSYRKQTSAADERLRKYREERATALATGGDVLAQFGKQATGTKANTAASKELEAQKKREAKALTDLNAQADIAIATATGLAAGYLAGTDKSREFTIQQKVEEALLKTGAGARAAVTKLLHDQQDALDRLAVSKAAYDIEKETADAIAQAKATLMGADALAAYNVQKAVTVALAGKNIEVGSKEYEQLLAANKAQQDAVRIAQQATSAGGIMDRLYPEAKLLKDYTEDQKALNAAMSLYPQNAAAYQAALAKLGQEYQINQSKATIWGQLTEGAVDRIDGVFAEAWGNIGSGADNLWDNLVKGAKQAFGEIAHMLTTKPLLASISNWLTGTDNGQGLSSVWGKLLGTATGQAGGSSSGGLGGLADMGKQIYSAYSAITGVGSQIASGYASGGLSGALSGGVNYYGSMLNNLGSTLTNGFSSLVGSITGQSAATQLAANAASAAAAQAAGVAAGNSLAVNAGAYAASAGTAAATGTAAAAGAGMYAQLAAMASNPVGWVVAAVTSAYQSGKLYDEGYRYDTKEILKDPVTVGAGGLLMEPAINVGISDKIFSSLFGGKAGAIISGSALFGSVIQGISSKLFGGSWQTKDGGISLGVKSGDFSARQYIDQKKKGGLFSSDKKRTKYSALDADTQDALGSTYNSQILNSLSLFSQLGVQLSDSVLDGLNVAAQKISTKGKTNEQIQTAIDAWFTTLGDSAVTAINKSTGAGLDGYTFDGLVTFINNLTQVNSGFELINLKMLGMTVAGGKLAESLLNAVGGMEQFTANNAKYYDGFFTDTEKADDTLAAVNKQFAAMGYSLPATRQGFRALVESLDNTTQSGAAAALTLIKYSDSAASAYSILEQRSEAATQAAAAVAEAQAAANASYYDLFTTDSQKSVDKLAGVRAEFKALGVELPGTRQAFMEMVYAAEQGTVAGTATAGALKKLATDANAAFTIIESGASVFANYYDLFTTDAEKSADKLSDVRAQFKALGIELPATRGAFMEMVYAAQQGTVSGKATADALLGLASGADAAYKILQAAATQGASNAFSALQRSIDAQKTSINDLLSTANTNVSDLTGVSNDLSSALKALRGDSDQAVASLRAQAQATLQDALAKARSGGSLAGFDGLSDALATVSDNNTNLYATLEDFNRDQGRTANVVAELNRLNGKQLTSAEKTALILQDQLKGLDDQLAYAQSQLDALNGVDNSVLGVTAAVNAMNAAVVAALTVQGKGAAQANTSQNNATLVNSIYRSLLGRDADAPGLAAWTGALQNGASYEQVLAAIKASAAANGQLVGHATGGYISGPGTGTSDSIMARLSNGEYVLTAAAVRAFGTDALDQMNALQIPAFAAGGPVVDVAAPSQMFASRAPSSFDGTTGNQQLAAQVRELIDVVKQVAGPIKVDSSKGRKLLEKWDANGIPDKESANA